MKAVRWVAQGVLAVMVLVAALWALSRFMPLPPAQQQALALLRQQTPVSGSNAFDALWLLRYDGVPDTARAAIMAEDARRIAALPPMSMDAEERMGGLAVDTLLSAAGQYPEVPAWQPPCHWSQAGCLAKVRADQAAVEAAVQGQQGLLARIDGLSAHGHYRNRFVPDIRAPFPDLALLQRSLSAHALAQVQGRSDDALAGICRDTRTGRMLMAHGDNLFVATVGAAMVQGSVQLFGEVLAEVPATQALPADCDGAFTVDNPQQLSLCPAMRGEFVLITHGGRVEEGVMQTLLWDREKSAGRTALTLQGACTDTAEQTLAQDKPLRFAAPELGLWRLECIANMMGCITTSIAGPAYQSYGMRLQDAGASLRLAEALLWLRAHSAADAATALAAMPRALRDGERPLTLSADGRQLQVASYSRRAGTSSISVPIPATQPSP